jgi:succinoglycan biosynthesis protein ExoM
VAVCALTFRRPRGLTRLVEGLRKLEIPDDAEVYLVVVDNDPEGSACHQIRAAQESFPWPVRYVVEPHPGIPAARNTAVRVADDADFVAFIDDDEVPDRRWLKELLVVQKHTAADVVTGPVLPDFEQDPPKWIVRGGFFDRPRFPTGERINWATTSSVLIARRLLEIAEPFNTDMQRTGGSDTHFFMRSVMEGATIVWADEALVSETIPETRMSASWIVRREYRRGNTLSICLRSLQDSPLRRVRRTAHAVLRIVQGLGTIGMSCFRGRPTGVRGLQRVAFGLGMITGLVGLRYEEYVVVHGS